MSYITNINHHFPLGFLLGLGGEASFFLESFLLVEGLGSLLLTEALKSFVSSEFLCSST